MHARMPLIKAGGLVSITQKHTARTVPLRLWYGILREDGSGLGDKRAASMDLRLGRRVTDRVDGTALVHQLFTYNNLLLIYGDKLVGVYSLLLKASLSAYIT